MKYYFVKQTTGERHVVLAEDEENLKSVLEKAKVEPNFYYELKENTFESYGFLISDTNEEIKELKKRIIALEGQVQEQLKPTLFSCK